jgi:hypothetical protein
MQILTENCGVPAQRGRNKLKDVFSEFMKDCPDIPENPKMQRIATNPASFDG